MGPGAEERESYALIQSHGSLFPQPVNTGNYPQISAFKFDRV